MKKYQDNVDYFKFWKVES